VSKPRILGFGVSNLMRKWGVPKSNDILRSHELEDNSLTPSLSACSMIAVVGIAKGSVLYCELKVAVPQIREGRTSERGGSVGGIVGVISCLSS
jgi:hypothetical protein